MDDKKLMDLLKDSAEDLTVPDSLSPEAVEHMLVQKQQSCSSDHMADTENQQAHTTINHRTGKRRRRFYFTRFAATAAVLVCCLTAAWQVHRIQEKSDALEQEEAARARGQVEQTTTENTDSAADMDYGNVVIGEADSSAVINENSSDEAAVTSSAVTGMVSADTDTASTGSTSSVSSDSADSADNISSASSGSADSADNTFSASSGSADSADNTFSASSSSADSADNTFSASSGSADSADSTASISPAASYEEVFEALHDQFYYEDYYDESSFYAGLGARTDGTDTGADEDGYAVAINEDAEMIVEDAEEEAADMTITSGSSASSDSHEYSTTNIQELGVDEADIVKTDGTYLYILHQDNTISIVDSDPQSLETVSVISPSDRAITSIQELYLDGDSLSIIANRYETSLRQEGSTYYTDSTEQTILCTYDITDRSEPKLTGTVTQDGYYKTSRKVGDYIYLFTSYYPDIRATYEESDIIPQVNGSSLGASDFYLPQQLSSSAYLLISSVNISNPDVVLDQKALVSGVSNFYVSTDHIYIANENYTSDTTVTELVKFSYSDGIITGLAAGSVNGYLNNSFSMNEYNGYLRVVSTCYNSSWEEQNALFILDESLNLTGSIENLAEGETIRSARFFGDTGYFVTFRQTDPLFSVDLSDPEHPKILGELKVTGFSSYLHFYSDDLLLGMGYEADEDTGEIYGVKLSMFDISDPSDVRELHRIVIPNVTWCPSLDNYKSIMIDPQKNLFGFFCSDRYLVFSYDTEKGFVSELVYDLVADAISQQADTVEEILVEDIDVSSSVDYSTSYYSSMNAYNTRGLYIDDVFYLAGDACVIAFDMNDDFNKIDTQ